VGIGADDTAEGERSEREERESGRREERKKRFDLAGSTVCSSDLAGFSPEFGGRTAEMAGSHRIGLGTIN
jgi:hypothetical protein